MNRDRGRYAMNVVRFLSNVEAGPFCFWLNKNNVKMFSGKLNWYCVFRILVCTSRYLDKFYYVLAAGRVSIHYMAYRAR